jgi:hypothetical protein
MTGVYSTAEPTEYSQTKCRAPAAFLAKRFQVACAAAAIRTAISAMVGMAVPRFQVAQRAGRPRQKVSRMRRTLLPAGEWHCARKFPLTRRRRRAPTQPAKVTPFAGGRVALSAEIPADAPKAPCTDAAGKNHAFCRRASGIVRGNSRREFPPINSVPRRCEIRDRRSRIHILRQLPVPALCLHSLNFDPP